MNKVTAMTLLAGLWAIGGAMYLFYQVDWMLWLSGVGFGGFFAILITNRR
jgi:hypothetical protein